MPTYADNVWHGHVTIEENAPMARDTYRVRFACPEIARRVLPGQFVMLRLAGCNDPLLGRALAFYDVTPDAGGRPTFIELAYLLVGKMTHRLADLQAGMKLDAWGPLGNGFSFSAASATPVEHLIMVAGGIGQTPFLTLARERLGLQTYGDPPRQTSKAKRVTLCYGVRSKDFFAGLDDFRRSGVEVRLSTDDGTAGEHGLVTALLAPVVKQSPWPCEIVSCGPEPMLAAVRAVAQELNVPCQVSLESPMACGIGICFSCVKKIRDAKGQWDYRRTCVEGPVFNAADVEF
jgi:dihydroorotate dehydrogenase electron transfer subunit